MKLTKKIKSYICKNPKNIEKGLIKAYKAGLNVGFKGIKSIIKKIAFFIGKAKGFDENSLNQATLLLDHLLDLNQKTVVKPLKPIYKKLVVFGQEKIVDLGLEQASSEIEIDKNKSFEFIKEQAQLIKNLNENALTQLKDICVKAHEESWDFKTLKESFREVAEISEKKAEFWARDQVYKKNAELTDNIESITNPLGYVWLHTGIMTKYVRREHLKRNNRFFLLDEIPKEEQPGRPYNCGCIKKLIFDPLMIPKKDRWKVKK